MLETLRHTTEFCSPHFAGQAIAGCRSWHWFVVALLEGDSVRHKTVSSASEHKNLTCHILENTAQDNF